MPSAGLVVAFILLPLLLSPSMHRLFRLLLLSDHHTSPPPLLLILGGSRDREIAAARLTASLPVLRSVRALVLSSGAATAEDLTVASAPGVNIHNVVIDRSAVDTVTNFTSTAAALVSNGIDHVAVSTSREHARRAKLVGTIIYGACGIHLSFAMAELDVAAECGATPQGLDASPPSEEGLARCIRDVLRALLWSVTGVDGTLFARLWHPHRAADAQRWAAGASPSSSSLPSSSSSGEVVTRATDPLHESDRGLSTMQRALLDCRERWPISAAICRWVIALCNGLGGAGGDAAAAADDGARTPLAWRVAVALMIDHNDDDGQHGRRSGIMDADDDDDDASASPGRGQR